MPNCFQLISKETGEAEKLSKIDDDLRVYMGAPPDLESYYRGWYDSFGLDAAMGDTWEIMLERYTDEERQKMLLWFKGKYDIRAWYSPN